MKKIRLGKNWGTRIDKGLEKAYDDLFSKDGGDRENYPNVMVVFTEGNPFPPAEVLPFNKTLPPPLRVRPLLIINFSISVIEFLAF